MTLILLSLFFIILCCLVIWRASDGFEVASEYLGRNLSEGVRGATINAIGSSMPELFTTLFFLFILFDKDGFAGGIGTTAGSAIFNGMIIPAVVILIVVFKRINSSVSVSRKVLLRDGIALLLCELILIFLLGGTSLTWVHGMVLMSLYGIYVTYMLTSMKRNQRNIVVDNDEVHESDNEEIEDNIVNRRGVILNFLLLDLEPIVIKDKINNKRSWVLLLLAMLIIGGACLLLVKSCEWLGDELGIPVYFIAVILASAATSVPDTILSMKDAEKGNYDDAVSNALGSNIFDVCFALGFPLFLFTIFYGPIQMAPETVINVSELRILLFILTGLAFIIYISKKKMGVLSAILLLSIYAAFTVYILGRSVDAEFADAISVYLHQINEYIDAIRFWS